MKYILGVLVAVALVVLSFVAFSQSSGSVRPQWEVGYLGVGISGMRWVSGEDSLIDTPGIIYRHLVGKEPPTEDLSFRLVIGTMNALGEEGWELVQFVSGTPDSPLEGRYYFKRPLQLNQ